uniref:Ankyrin repeat family protein n=1 Tax=Zea mays TaxID=4577 RepID=Q5GAP7_MAIZE|nr:unknown [Zea mays]AAV64243.1 unknown [Zea mays]
MGTPPPFQESGHCDVCRCTFNTFRRRALPQYGIYTDVRVCYGCFNKSSSQGHADNPVSAGSISGAADSFSGLSLGKEDDSSPMKNSTVQSTAALIECKCGMPLCICEAPKPEPSPTPVKNINTVPPTTQSNPRPKKPANTQQKASATSSSNSSPFLNIGLMNNDSNDKGIVDYEVSGEGLREAIKGGDVKGVKKLLTQAALFNQTEIALILMDHGANVESKNGQDPTHVEASDDGSALKLSKKMFNVEPKRREYDKGKSGLSSMLNLVLLRVIIVIYLVTHPILKLK